MRRVTIDVAGFWRELRRRRVVRFALWYVALAMAGIQVADALLDAFERSELMPLVISAIAAGFPVAIVLSWFFDITPSGVELTAPAPLAPALPAAAPAGSIAVLPFANLGGAEENEYFSDGLADEIRNELARQPGLRVAARTSSSAFKNRSEDVREIARQLNVAALLEGGVRKHQDTVRIHVQLIGASDGFQLWSANFERDLEDIFRVQGEIAAAVTQAVAPLSARAAEHAPATANFEAYNLYLRGRHHFHKRTEAALQRAVECFEQAIALDPGYALAWSGLGDACALLSTRFYGNLTLEAVLAKALPAAERALALDPQLAEAHATLGLLRRLQGDLAGAEAALARALTLNPGYSMALVWRGLVLGDQGRFAEVEECDREALRVDPLSPIVNANVGFDRLRRGDHAAARARFEAAIEIDGAFPVPHYGLARVSAAEGDLDGALGHMGAAIERAPHRAYYRARRAVVLLQAGRLDEAAGALAEGCCISPENPFDEDLVVALHIARGETDTLRCIATGECARRFATAPRAQAAIAVGDHASALALYAGRPPERRRELVELVTDDWVWRLPHVLNHAHLRHRAGEPEGSAELQALLEDLGRIAAQGIVSPLLHYWAAGAHAVLGQEVAARTELARARERGWKHDWWQQVDWNLGLLGAGGV